MSRSNHRPTADLYPFELQEPIPTSPLPLRRGDLESVVALQALVHGVTVAIPNGLFSPFPLGIYTHRVSAVGADG